MGLLNLSGYARSPYLSKTPGIIVSIQAETPQFYRWQAGMPWPDDPSYMYMPSGLMWVLMTGDRIGLLLSTGTYEMRFAGGPWTPMSVYTITGSETLPFLIEARATSPIDSPSEIISVNVVQLM